MDVKTYRRTTEGSFKDRKVKNTRPLRNGLYAFPCGITWTIQRKQGGFSLFSDKCPHCGIQAWISKVQPGDVDFADQAELGLYGASKR